VKSNGLALAKFKKFGSNVGRLTKLTFFFNMPITGLWARLNGIASTFEWLDW